MRDAFGTGGGAFGGWPADGGLLNSFRKGEIVHQFGPLSAALGEACRHPESGLVVLRGARLHIRIGRGAVWTTSRAHVGAECAPCGADVPHLCSMCVPCAPNGLSESACSAPNQANMRPACAIFCPDAPHLCRMCHNSVEFAADVYEYAADLFQYVADVLQRFMGC